MVRAVSRMIFRPRCTFRLMDHAISSSVSVSHEHHQNFSCLICFDALFDLEALDCIVVRGKSSCRIS